MNSDPKCCDLHRTPVPVADTGSLFVGASSFLAVVAPRVLNEALLALLRLTPCSRLVCCFIAEGLATVLQTAVAVLAFAL